MLVLRPAHGLLLHVPLCWGCHRLEGYTRDPHDRTRCKANEGHAALLFTHRTDIRRYALDRQELTAIVNETRSSTALDFHFESGMLFW